MRTTPGEFREWLQLPETEEALEAVSQYAIKCWWDVRGFSNEESLSNSAGFVCGLEDAVRFLKSLGDKV